MNNFLKNHKGWLAILIVVISLIIDQVIKINVKTSMSLGESIRITDWFYINFIENNGMAWGMTFFNKMVLSLFRLVAISLIGYYLYGQIKKNARLRYVVCLALILAGAFGNMVDSMFYGLIFNASSPYYVSYFVPFGQGYSSFLLGKVVDMFYFPLIVATWPDWFPFWGGEEFVFFSPVFNYADACVSVGVISMLLFCRKDLDDLSTSFSTKRNKKNPVTEEDK
ncbi:MULTISPECIES: lipoprotein signal peptidase [Segatella]|jgi:signal peptidase II|uniref:Lipoprotein signal peptidase n=1 Tax=Segatella bryantii TaxID=77095 RepID=A0AA37HW83_SEGBR|nr:MULTISPECIES: lipoprotein signal peptidase [Segatella]MBQ3857721.1 lipoprotein signal peptidase [Prevotella sp.]MDR4930746.1 lipoprotein signal peptidase [Segatella bryantii]MEE3415257.1 lipoprotein signal peptidase [Prevotella sp.]UKK73755.1 lipoprotein signal peptidase [Segatella bryantii]UKK76886.1 lipoprotein signal peptidase [Segatella bryantii]